MRNALVLFIALLSPALPAGEVWIFLKDGRVGLGDPEKMPIQLAFADGTRAEITKDLIFNQRTREQADQAIDGMIQDIVGGKNIPEHTVRLQSYRAAGVPRLLTYLKHADARMRLTALYAFQFCFAPEAKEPVLAALKDTDSDVRKTAFAALSRNLPEPELSDRLQPFADGDDLSVAALVFETVERHHPDPSLKRIKRLLSDPRYQSAVLPRLSHYRSSQLSNQTLPLLNSANMEIVRAGVVGLITQLADAAPVRAKVRELLASPNVDVREIAAEYFTWLGKIPDVEALQLAQSKETDPYIKAALDAALKIVSQRDRTWNKFPGEFATFNALHDAEPLEPTLIYGLTDIADKDAVRERSFQLQEALVAPCGNLRESMTFLSPASQEASATHMPPLRDFFDQKRKSFGLEMTNTTGAFSNSVHVGDDVSWRKELRTVVAMAPGVVRSVEHAYSWGFIVIVEHKLSEERSVCSLYAHLSPMIHVKPGDVVKMGQKIGCTGRSQCVENGGYVSHLHFGLHDGPYTLKSGGWVCGYIGVDRWKNGEHGWLEPQAFLKAP